MTRGLSRNTPSELLQNPSFLDKSAVFKCQDTPELFTLKFGQKVVPEYLCSNHLLLPAERGDSWAIMGLGISKKSQKGHYSKKPKFSVVNVVILKNV